MSDDLNDDDGPGFAGFLDGRRVAEGDLPGVAVGIRRALAANQAGSALVFDRGSGQVIDLDLRGTEAEIIARLAPPEASPPQRGRPRLGVVAREVTLLPRHWAWLARQPGGASVTLRRLLEAARKADAAGNGQRARTEAAYRFMAAMAGDLSGFEEATRALFAGDHARLAALMGGWPPDIRAEALRFVDGPPRSRADA